jgi:S-adenosylmethionine decarboxylase
MESAMKDIRGTHLLIDGYVSDPKTLEPEHLNDLFDELVNVLDMQYLQRPIAIRVPADLSKLSSDDDEGGWSIVAQITTSHIALHGWPLRCAFMMDIFSCRPFDTEAAKTLVYRLLDVELAVTQGIERAGPARE